MLGWESNCKEELLGQAERVCCWKTKRAGVVDWVCFACLVVGVLFGWGLDLYTSCCCCRSFYTLGMGSGSFILAGHTDWTHGPFCYGGSWSGTGFRGGGWHCTAHVGNGPWLLLFFLVSQAEMRNGMHHCLPFISIAVKTQGLRVLGNLSKNH